MLDYNMTFVISLMTKLSKKRDSEGCHWNGLSNHFWNQINIKNFPKVNEELLRWNFCGDSDQQNFLTTQIIIV